MVNKLIKPYEISIWEDVLKQESANPLSEKGNVTIYTDDTCEHVYEAQIYKTNEEEWPNLKDLTQEKFKELLQHIQDAPYPDWNESYDISQSEYNTMWNLVHPAVPPENPAQEDVLFNLTIEEYIAMARTMQAEGYTPSIFNKYVYATFADNTKTHLSCDKNWVENGINYTAAYIGVVISEDIEPVYNQGDTTLHRPESIKIGDFSWYSLGYSYFEENKIAIIGSDTMTAPFRAISPVLTKDINGSNTLTFTLYTHYYDEDINDFVINPMLSHITNETKIKLKYDNKWYDFTVKNIEENSEDKTHNFTCTDMFIDELSKTGFNIVLDNELQNNQGTITELAEKVLEESDWELGQCDILTQFIIEPLYELVYVDNASPSNPMIGIGSLPNINSVEVENNDKIYVPYSVLTEKKDYFQFLFHKGVINYPIDEDGVIIEEKEDSWYGGYTLEGNTTYNITGDTVIINDKYTFLNNGISHKYKGKRVGRSIKTTYDPVTDRVVNIYKGKNNNLTYYGYTDTNYIPPSFKNNIIINGNNFESFKGWSANGNKVLDLYYSPSWEAMLDGSYTETDINSFLHINSSDIPYFNSCIKTNFDVKQFSEGMEYAFRVQAYTNPEDISSTCGNNFRAKISSYKTDENGNYILGADYFDFNLNDSQEDEFAFQLVNITLEREFNELKSQLYTYNENSDVFVKVEQNEQWNSIINYWEKEEGFYYCTAKCRTSLTQDQLEKENIGLFIYPTVNNATDIYIKNIQLFSFEEKKVTILQLENINSNLEFNNLKTTGKLYWYNKKENEYILVSNLEEWDNEHQTRTYYLKNNNMVSNNRPLCPGEYKDAQAQKQNYYYEEPKGGQTASSINYIILDSFDEKNNNYVPEYDETFSKIKSISATESNRFNIIQDLSEAFECWAKFNIEHDEDTGKIKINNYKKVNPKEFKPGVDYYVSTGTNDLEVQSYEIINKYKLINDTDLYNPNLSYYTRDNESHEMVNLVINDIYYKCENLSKSDFTKYKLELYINDKGLYIPVPKDASFENIDYYEKDFTHKKRLDYYGNIYEIIRPDPNIQYYEYIPGRQVKSVSFYEYISKDNYTGFKYGINLNSIERTIDGESIVSKMIVKDNSNEFAKDGFCSIAKAQDNPTGQTFLYNFDYYIQQGLLDRETTDRDLYNYYNSLKSIQKDRNKKIELLSEKQMQFDKLESQLDVLYQLQIETAAEIQSKDLELYSFDENHKSYDDIVNRKDIGNLILDSKEVQSYLKTIYTLRRRLYEYEAELSELSPRYETLSGEIESIKRELELNSNKITALNREFYTKYSRFIKEGTWNSDDYYDDNLYYYDSLSVLNTSKSPQTSYTINVTEISEIEGFEPYKFDIGDKTYIEDVEFFGYQYNSNNELVEPKTPYKEEVIINNVTFNLNEPENNTITVQNYKTRFEDLFQRISATVASLEFNQGSYGRAAAAITPNGEIDKEVLQKTLENNSFNLIGNTNGIEISNDKIVIKNKDNTPSIKLASGGLYTWEGNEWSLAISGKNGMESSKLSSGRLDTSQIYIMSNGETSFRWDTKGITAYNFDKEGKTDYNKFVRLDKYGVYGVDKIKDNNNDWTIDNALNTSVYEQIKQNAFFGLTYDGFFLKSSHGDGYVEISNENDIKVKTYIGNYHLDENNNYIAKDSENNYTDRTITRVEIGNLDECNYYLFNLDNSVDFDEYKINLYGKIEAEYIPLYDFNYDNENHYAYKYEKITDDFIIPLDERRVYINNNNNWEEISFFTPVGLNEDYNINLNYFESFVIGEEVKYKPIDLQSYFEKLTLYNKILIEENKEYNPNIFYYWNEFIEKEIYNYNEFLELQNELYVYEFIPVNTNMVYSEDETYYGYTDVTSDINIDNFNDYIEEGLYKLEGSFYVKIYQEEYDSKINYYQLLEVEVQAITVGTFVRKYRPAQNYLENEKYYTKSHTDIKAEINSQELLDIYENMIYGYEYQLATKFDYLTQYYDNNYEEVDLKELYFNEHKNNLYKLTITVEEGLDYYYKYIFTNMYFKDSKYGLRIKDINDKTVLQTDDSGHLILEGNMTVSGQIQAHWNNTKEKYDLYIGDKGVTLGNFLAWDTESNKFYLYEGVVWKDKNGIEQTIDEIQQTEYNIQIISTNGIIFKTNTFVTVLEAHVFYKGEEISWQRIQEIGELKWYKIINKKEEEIFSGQLHYTILDNTLIIDNESFINNKANYTVKLISKKNI